jgi:hypothetical protein
VANTRTIPETGRRGRPRELRRLPVSDVTVARGSAALLWLLVLLAALGGLTAFLRPTSSNNPAPKATGSDDPATGAAIVEAEGFAERYVTAYLEAGNDGTVLAPFLGYTPELPPTAKAVQLSAPVRATDISKAAKDYWSVTIAVGWTGQERYWQVAVDLRKGHMNAVGLPAQVAPPAEPKRSSLQVNMQEPDIGDPAVQTVTGFLEAYLCGSGELSRYLSPGLSLTAAKPKVCDEVQVIRWGVVKGDGQGNQDKQTVVFDAMFDSHGRGGFTPRLSTYTLLLTDRDGRWEVTDLLPAPPLSADD